MSDRVWEHRGYPLPDPHDPKTCGNCHEVTRPHIHLWSIGHVSTEVVGEPYMMSQQVAYLLCQCGTVMRVIAE